MYGMHSGKVHLNFRLDIKSYGGHACKKEAEEREKGRKDGRKYITFFALLVDGIA